MNKLLSFQKEAEELLEKINNLISSLKEDRISPTGKAKLVTSIKLIMPEEIDNIINFLTYSFTQAENEVVEFNESPDEDNNAEEHISESEPEIVVNEDHKQPTSKRQRFKCSQTRKEIDYFKSIGYSSDNNTGDILYKNEKLKKIEHDGNHFWLCEETGIYYRVAESILGMNGIFPESGYRIYFKNQNKFDNRLSNLEYSKTKLRRDNKTLSDSDVETICTSLCESNGNINGAMKLLYTKKLHVSTQMVRNIRNKRRYSEISDAYFRINKKIDKKVTDNCFEINNQKKQKIIDFDSIITEKMKSKINLTQEEMCYIVNKISRTFDTKNPKDILKWIKVYKYPLQLTDIEKILRKE